MSEHELNYLLTDDFIRFSEEIAKIHAEKKRKKEELKKIFEQYQSELKAFDELAKQVNEEWEAWKREQDKQDSN